ncbi:uncharacterized protein LOC127123277 [Lathyrus oleraceus]|uniref:uncharacterized protein LOC127123277 n=1 Tax=Pisum sativum TaxID=3888 RepID=UPI0021CE1E61|nr:uncharacterized protein LOC127123277 [Pisum sativum]
MDIRRRNTQKYSFRCPDLMELRKLASFVDDPKGLRDHFGRLLFVLSTDFEDGLLCTLVQFYDHVYRCFTFPDYQLLPTVEEYAYLLGIPVSDSLPFSGVEVILESRVVAEAIHLRKSDIDANLIIKGGIRELTSKNPVPTLLGDAYFFIHHRTSKGGECIVCCVPLLYKWCISHLPQSPTFQENKDYLRWSQRLMSLTNNEITWYSSVYNVVEIIDSYGELSNVPILST